MERRIPWKKLAKYVTGNCNADERDVVEQWIDADPSHKNILDELVDIWQHSTEGEGWADLLKKMKN